MLVQLGGRVAVVTGAASGIGLALSRRLAAEGMRVAMADIEAPALAGAAAELRASGASILDRVVDVSNDSSVSDFAAEVMDNWGVPHLVCNNAGVGGGWAPAWSATPKDWDWMLGVNLYGVVNGVRAFLPAMLDGGDEGHLVNTSSVAGLMTGPGDVYGVTKHAVQRYTEGLWYELQARGGRVGISALCPGIVATRINTGFRNRPSHLVEDGRPPMANVALFEEMDARYAEAGMPPDDVAGAVVEAVRQDRFYILTHPGVKDLVRLRAEAIVKGVQPPERPAQRKLT
jgi:NAD(P)-dependent dehydrogenase (short-subunit alcohol dehydrogenase family)